MSTSPCLTEIEQCFMESVRCPRARDHFALLLRHDDVHAARRALSASAISQRIGAYVDSARGTLIKTLHEIYPVCEKLVGKPFFMQVAQAYIDATPSYTPDLLDFGQAFPLFLENYALLRDYPYMSDVARLEWAYAQVVIGRNARTVDRRVLEELDEQQTFAVRFHLIEHAHFLQSPYPVSVIWQANQDDYAGEAEINLQSGAQHLIIYRLDFDTHIDLITEQEYGFLTALREGHRLGEIIEASEYEPAAILTLLTRALARGYIDQITL